MFGRKTLREIRGLRADLEAVQEVVASAQYRQAGEYLAVKAMNERAHQQAAEIISVHNTVDRGPRKAW